MQHPLFSSGSKSLWPDYLEAFVNSERGGFWHQRVMGRRLRPFCAHHALWLEAVESPLWRGGAGKNRVTLADLDLAARICASDWNEVSIARPTRLARWWFTARALCGRGQFERWKAYLGDYLSPPHRERFKASKPDTSDPLGRMGITARHETIGRPRAALPDTLLLVAGLMHLGHVSAREAFTMPYSQAEWLLAGLQHQAGQEGNVSTEHDREFMLGLSQAAPDAVSG